MLNKLLRLIQDGLWIVVIGISMFSLNAQAATNNTLALLLPNAAVQSDPRIQAWFDATKEDGLQLKVILDSELLQLGGTTAALQYRGIIMPDQVHTQASKAVIDELQLYVNGGGNLMLVFDAGVLNDLGFYPIPKSRFSDLVGVDYVLSALPSEGGLYPNLVGLGPVTGMESTLEQLQAPPGKSMLYSTATTGSPTLATAKQSPTEVANPNQPLANAQKSLLYLPVSPNNPGGLQGYDASYYHNVKHEVLKKNKPIKLEKPSKAITGPDPKAGKYPPVSAGAILTQALTTDSALSTRSTLALPDTLNAISGYGYGYLTYPSYVTRGNYTGSVLLSSPNFGLVAGYKPVNTGGVLFVNLPLSFLKGQTDGMLMQGFLHYFAVNLLHLPYLSNHPRAIGGLVLNWHFDAAEAVGPAQQLNTAGVFNDGPFSIHVTAGPDTVNPGDKLGLNVSGNKAIQTLISTFAQKNFPQAYGQKRHQIGNHGGWIHDYYGLNASETQTQEFVNYLAWNKRDIDARLTKAGKPASTEYSAPEGNNPKWAVNWIQQNGAVGYYFTGHTGMAPTQTYRDGQLMNPGLWAFPVTPFGQYATNEEFQDFGVNSTDVNNWLQALVDFCVKNRTSRLIYFHPPGAWEYPDNNGGVIKTLLSYAKGKGTSSFNWYTMTDLAKFNKDRLATTWTITVLQTGLNPGLNQFTASTTLSSLKDQTWLLPKLAFSQPSVTSGSATVITTDADNWLVMANTNSGKTLIFTAMPR